MLRTTAQKKLNNVMGEDRGSVLFADICREVGLDDLHTPNDSLRFGEALIARGGLLASIGRSIKMQAVLFGAAEG